MDAKNAENLENKLEGLTKKIKCNSGELTGTDI